MKPSRTTEQVRASFPPAMAIMEAAFHQLARRVPQPKQILQGNGFVYRYLEQTVEQALIQKLARVVSGVLSATVLLENGLVQEQGAIQRMLDELMQDIQFLSGAIIFGHEKLHTEYLQAFYAEDYSDPSKPVETLQPRNTVSRKYIRAYITRAYGLKDPSTEVAIAKALTQTYSGFLHAASPHIMDMYGGTPPKFHVSGLLGTPRIDDHTIDLWNYYYRGLHAAEFVAIALKDNEVKTELASFIDAFGRTSP